MKAARIIGLLLGATLMACGDDDKHAPMPSCVAASLEQDLDATPFQGSGADPKTGALQLAPGKVYVISSTYGVPLPGPNGAPVTEKYGQLFGDIETQLGKETGLVAFRLASSDDCGSGRTLAVWDSEEAMYGFVTSDAHSAAMTAVHDVLKPGYAVTHWQAGSEDEMTFTHATTVFSQDAKR